MRCEIKKARSCEKEAIENNKTVIATISHDIKTPIASIRAYTEALKLNMDSTPERKDRYLSVIIKKCDEVSKLTNDLFLHSLSDLEKLEITCTLHKSDIVIPEILESIVSNQIDVNIVNEIPKCNINVDIRRLEQVFENIISNSIKYSYGEKIDIDFKTDNSYLICSLKDYGKGIADEDMPFIFEKFYRGKNTDTKPGAGLGLFIVKYIMGQMNGDVSVTNRNDGLQTHVLNHINLEIYKNDFTVIMGSAGSGKSTLLYCLSGMDNVTSGEVYFNEKPIHKMKNKELANFRRNEIGYIFQQMQLVSSISLYENIIVPGYLAKKFSVSEVNDRADKLLEHVNIYDCKKRLPSQVSGGQKQRAAIARALINEPKLIYADEPTGALNSKSGTDVLNLLTELNRKGQSILMVTHDVKAAIIANRIIYIEDGNISTEMNMQPYKEEDKKSRETQVLSYLASKGW